MSENKLERKYTRFDREWSPDPDDLNWYEWDGGYWNRVEDDFIPEDSE